ncbi:TorD/DmsD family molecular chaperone, partial [Campylobacter coli]
MDLEKLRLARSLYYQCLGELFVFSFSENRLCNLKA